MEFYLRCVNLKANDISKIQNTSFYIFEIKCSACLDAVSFPIVSILLKFCPKDNASSPPRSGKNNESS